jgi:hypothetical protein
MSKRRTFAGRAPKEALDRLFTQWTTNAAEFANRYPDDQRTDELMEGLVRTFDAVSDQHDLGGQTTIIVMWQPRLPDFESDDREYGDAPF